MITPRLSAGFGLRRIKLRLSNRSSSVVVDPVVRPM
jgi:hypothetical protein